jgi:hypothetical protein
MIPSGRRSGVGWLAERQIERGTGDHLRLCTGRVAPPMPTINGSLCAIHQSSHIAHEFIVL